ncbi:hypothetical protein YPPY66_1892 [Yersinia pestis PY-66]|nr:hypothetical protein YPPY05_1675 [Yersinia pestis PY-05]EIR22639.1 hypothetical protein YPPY09_1734 [Yersinia pestis PY-09]EIR80077.1 hypothetical protein YPPY32_1966 [Yersinia pestis PY-32]EIS08432.1 hypothetical protein YPPY48_1733 [Yersinia pestis PY-48]EIS64410.1 hypothetical protein YPPY64_1744 [Yersinia pestis PY-64]EIS79796.1 hypothetical protein YPPY66_1892 [Yersinia pestis PY-66]EIS93868.1 hypothetical protein YPPY88_1729 [Yersinia pestis PY-88]EIT18644.1 hypothetical protein YPP
MRHVKNSFLFVSLSEFRIYPMNNHNIQNLALKKWRKSSQNAA